MSEGVIKNTKHLYPKKLTSTQFAGDGSACAQFFLDLKKNKKKTTKQNS